MKSIPHSHFRPRDGALLDLESLEAIAATPSRLLGAALGISWPGASALVLNGLEMSGEWSLSGPPGTRRPDQQSKGVTVSPGRAILTDRTGLRYFLEVDEPLEANWPTQAGVAVKGVLVMIPRVEAASMDGGVVVAREQVQLQLGFVKPEQVDQSHVLPLAASIGNGRDWATDIKRIWQPEHAAILVLLKRFEELEQLVWRAEPEGGVWDRQVLGRNWVRYQTVAASSLQAARIMLETKPSSTIDRVRLLCSLRRTLQNSVESAATELMQIVGTKEGAGPYLPVIEGVQ